MNHHVLGFVLLLSFACYCSSDETLGKVIFVNILYRHGARTPLETYPNDPYKNESLWSAPFGQLTNVGKHQHFLHGRWLRNRYSHLLSSTYKPDDIYVLSSDVDRTLMSAEANLAGMYPPSGNQVWDIKEWMPIPVHTIPANDDNLLMGKKYCESYWRELRRVLASPEIRKIEDDNAELYEYLSEHTGKKISALKDIGYLYSALRIEEMSKKPLPAWTKPVYPSVLKSLAEKNFEIAAYNKILQRLKSGPLLKEMINHMELKSMSALRPNRKLWVYSAHDFTIANLMMTLGVFDKHIPLSAASLLMELRIDARDNYFVTIFYKNSTEEPTLITLPGCLPACPLDQFVQLTKDVVPENWEQECAVGFEEESEDATNSTITMILPSVAFLLLWFAVFISWLSIHVYRQKEEKHNCHHNITITITDTTKTLGIVSESKECK